MTVGVADEVVVAMSVVVDRRQFLKTQPLSLPPSIAVNFLLFSPLLDCLGACSQGGGGGSFTE